MKLLLDTHVWVWAIIEPSWLVRRVSSAFENLENELWLSPISVGEALLLCEKRRLESNTDAWGKISASLTGGKLSEAGLTFDVAQEAARVHLPHRDPADRYLVATARFYDLTLVTADERLLQIPDLKVLAAR